MVADDVLNSRMAQQGFVYEENTVKFLAPMGLCEKVFAGASHDKPDLTLLRGKESAGCELKITAASAGSLVLKHTNGKWGFNDTSDDPEKDFIAGIAKKVGLMKLIEKSWKTKPLKRTPVDATLKAQIGKMTPEQIYRRDQANFPDIIGSIPATAIEEYYNAKKTWYVNVGTHGFYLMGTKDPLGYNKRLAKIKMPAIPMFGKAAQAKYRARVQYKGSNAYQFTFEMQFAIPSANKSPYNIAPVDGKSVTILKKDANISCLTA